MAETILNNYPEYELTIGIEVHVQLNTKSKMFCASANEVGCDPNQNLCNICAGYPGALPVVNSQAVDYAIRAGLATNCTISPISTFDRKHYFYPDLPKNYQITQQFEPVCKNGHITIRLEDGSTKTIRLNRIHMEEDAGKNSHADASNESFVDLNRAGTPLLEIVSEPDITSIEEAKQYLKTLRALVQYLGICSGNMEEGAFRADTNVSVKKKSEKKLGTRCELKNINSFKFIGDAIAYEVERQLEIITSGGSVTQETRLWDSKNKKTVSMRSKEEAADYRYFQDPDLPIIAIDNAWIDATRKALPELPDKKFERFVHECNLTPYEADILVDDIDLANYYDAARTKHTSKQIINWILRDVLGYLKEHAITLREFKLTPEHLAHIIDLLESNKINNHAAKEVFTIVAQTGQSPIEVVKVKGLEQIDNTAELEKIVRDIIQNNPSQVTEYKSGNERLLGFFVGQAMKATQGKGNPKTIQELVKSLLS